MILDYLSQLDRKGIVLSLNPTSKALNLLNNPHHKFPSILVAGTNGKGSTVAMLTSVLRRAGYRVGTYISPHLLDIRERVMLDGEMIPKKDFESLVQKLKKQIEKKSYDLSFFEFMTVLAFLYFKEKKVDIAVVEVGLGGRWDATNVLEPLVSVITTVGFDHQKFLGNTLTKIAFEKAGIIKKNGILVSGVQQLKIQKQLAKITRSKKSILLQLGKDFFESQETLSLKGAHQKQNAACVIAVLRELIKKRWIISQKNIQEGLASTRWPGRLEVVQEKPKIILDGAHNPSGIKVLIHSLKEFQYKKLHVVMGVMKDKNYKKMIEDIYPLADSFCFVEPPIHRTLLGEKLIQEMPYLKSKIQVQPKISEALAKIIERADQNDIVCVTGSLYTVAEAKKIFI